MLTALIVIPISSHLNYKDYLQNFERQKPGEGVFLDDGNAIFVQISKEEKFEIIEYNISGI